MKKDLTKILEKLPASPGVYQFLNEKNEPLYIGKAKQLKKRVSSYFRKSAKHSVRIKKMLEQVVDLKWTETNSEIESLILEDNLVKELQPKYNVLLRDDKTFQYIKVTVQNDYPEILTTRKLEKDGAKYFGPKTSGSDVRRIIEGAKRIFKLCSVKNITLNPKGVPLEGAKVAVKVGGSAAKRPCLDYHIKRCLGPCAGMVSSDEYRRQIDQAVDFLNGHYAAAIDQLKTDMRQFASEKKFERAARVRDQIEAIERSAEKQLITDTHIVDRDVVGCVEDLGRYFFNLFQVRAGRLIGQENFVVENGETPAEAMEVFLRDYYALAADIPKEILVSVQLEHTKLLKDYIRRFTSKVVQLIHPQAGKKDDLILLSEKNARSFAQQNRVKWMADKREEKALEELKTALKLDKIPNRIECYDISHLSGTETVGSMVVFKKGKPSSADYRQFRMKTTKEGEIDDFKCMKEVINRRLNYLPALLPDDYELRKAKKSDETFIKKIWSKLEDIDVKQFYVICYKKEVVAMGRVSELNEKVHELGALWVSDNHQNNALDKFILNKLIDASKNKRLYFFCASNLENHYLDLGWQTLHRPPKEMKNRANEVLKKTKQQFDPVFMAYQKKKKDPSFSARPDLMVIDGGKGQLSAAYDALDSKSQGLIPMVSLAKRLEEVFVPGKSNPIELPVNTEASYLLQRIRDEAHRFAITLNRNRRDKKMVKSALDEVVGVGPKMKKRLLTYFGTVEKIKQAPQVVLEQVVGEKMAKIIKQDL